MTVTGARCSQCDGSGWDSKAGPRDDELLDRVVLSAVKIDELHAEIERLQVDGRRLRTVIADMLPYIEDIQDEGPRDEGWRSEGLMRITKCARAIVDESKKA